jgi:hypothetical protein
MDFAKISNETLKKHKITLGFKILALERVVRRTKAKLDEIQAELVRRGLAEKTETVDYKAKYEKCIETIKRFDPGIIGMYDL